MEILCARTDRLVDGGTGSFESLSQPMAGLGICRKSN